MEKQTITRRTMNRWSSMMLGAEKLMLLMLLGMLLISCESKAQDGVPKEVKASFQNKYPGEGDPDWHKDSNGNYESNFKKDGKHYRADFSPNGDWIETERSMDKGDLPEKVRDMIKDLYDDYEIVEVEEVDHHSKGLFYDVEFKHNGDKKDVEFSPDGQVLQ
ncbi:PepSY-like domain-containing protein [Sediminicola sp. 1XM1-17]|uniref:PepSY-like domain-containing protein n=1 Tax=Sediminicola sp. 1XM1-17 TaxID=3127702 RepID=UPI003077B3B9